MPRKDKGKKWNFLYLYTVAVAYFVETIDSINSIRIIRFNRLNGKLLDDAKADKTFLNEYDEDDVDYPEISSSNKFPERYEVFWANGLQKIKRN